MNMVEDIGKIISNSFGTYTKNLNICIPFILNFFISILLVVLLASFGFAGIFGSSLSNIENVKTPEEVISILLPSIMQHIIEIAILVMIIFLLVFSSRHISLQVLSEWRYRLLNQENPTFPQ